MTLRKRTSDKLKSCLLSSVPFNEGFRFTGSSPKGEWWSVPGFLPPRVPAPSLCLHVSLHPHLLSILPALRVPPLASYSVHGSSLLGTYILFFKWKECKAKGCVSKIPKLQTVKNWIIQPELVVLSILAACGFIPCNLELVEMRKLNHIQQGTECAHCPSE